MLQNVLFFGPVLLILLQPVMAAQELNFFLFNDTLLMPTTGLTPAASTGVSCFPALGFKMPATIPSSLDGWWCDSSTEYAFDGFSYEISQCEFDPSPPLVHRLTFVIQARARVN